MSLFLKVAFGLGMLGTLVLGLLIRAQLAGHMTDLGSFAWLRHAHSHLGYYGILFPLTWLVWRLEGFSLPGLWLFALYGLATAAAIVGFIVGGYWLLSIAASAVVGLVWVVVSFKTRKLPVLRGRDGLSLGPLAVVLAGTMVPPIAVLTRRDPLQAQLLVHSFLSLLITLVFIPAALRRLQVPLPTNAWVLLSGLLASMQLGIFQHPVGALGLFIYAGLHLWALLGARKIMPSVALAAFLPFFLALLALALKLLPTQKETAVAGFHYLFLGPLFIAAALHKTAYPRLLLWLWLLVVGAFSGAIFLTGVPGLAASALQGAVHGGAAIVIGLPVLLVIWLKIPAKSA